MAPARRRQAERNLRLASGHPLVTVADFFLLGYPPKSNIDTKNDVFFFLRYLLSNMASFWVSMLVFGGVKSKRQYISTSV